MTPCVAIKLAPVLALVAALVVSVAPSAQEPSPLFELSRRPTSTMSNPYRLIENWPTLRPGMEWGAAIGLIPDGTGGTWMMFRSEPPINYINADGQITKSFGDGMIVQAHGFCMDGDGNLWAGDSGPFGGRSVHRGARLPTPQVQSGRRAADESRAGGSFGGGRGHLHRPDVLRAGAERQHHRRRRALAATLHRPAGRGPTGGNHGHRRIRAGRRAARAWAGRVHGTARTGVRLPGAAVRR